MTHIIFQILIYSDLNLTEHSVNSTVTSSDKEETELMIILIVVGLTLWFLIIYIIFYCLLNNNSNRKVHNVQTSFTNTKLNSNSNSNSICQFIRMMNPNVFIQKLFLKK